MSLLAVILVIFLVVIFIFLLNKKDAVEIEDKKESVVEDTVVKKIKSPIKVRTQEELYKELVKNAKPDGYKSTPILDGYILIDILEITGVHLEGRYNDIKRIKRDSELILEKENTNPYDRKAVRILHDYLILGYVDRGSTSLVRRIMNNGYKCLLYDFTNESNYKKATYAIYVIRK